MMAVSHLYRSFRSIIHRTVGADILSFPSQASVTQYLNGMKWVLHANEYCYLASLPITERIEIFSRFWTLKEALLKGKGVGIADSSQPPGSFDFSAAQKEGGVWIAVVCRWICVSWVDKSRALAVAFEWTKPIQTISLIQSQPHFTLHVNSTSFSIIHFRPELNSILLFDKEVI